MLDYSTNDSFNFSSFNTDFNIKNIQLNKFNSKYTLKIFNYYYYHYSNYFSAFSLKNSIFLKNYFYFHIRKSKEKISFLNFFTLKKNFFKTMNLMFNIIFLNYLPNIITEFDFENDFNNFKTYLNFITMDSILGFTFCTSPYVKIKKITSAKVLKIPMVSVADLNTNLK